MLFNSFSFIVFFVVVIALHHMRFPWKIKKTNLLLASYLFYAVWNPPFILLLWFSTLFDFYAGRKLYQEENIARRKLLLVLSLLINLGLLGFFKYGGFLLDNFVAILSAVGIDFHPAKPNIILPVGISFYTFQSLSYTLDMYKRKGLPEKSLLDYALFVTFFPQLVAGPIVRQDELTPQFKQPHQATKEGFMKGMLLLSLGLFMKVVMADTLLAGPADQVFGASQKLETIDAWLGVLAFSGQIFFDFGGYSTCAIGVAACLGFSLPDNFRYPYAATGFSDFWRRWHITLSTWLRDYLYIPLGGNRRGVTRTYINLMLTMLLGGLWHGASWTFVVWGALHGTYLCVERFIRSKQASTQAILISIEPALAANEKRMITKKGSFVPSFLQIRPYSMILTALFVFFMVNIAWVFFRAADFATAWRLLNSMFGINENGIALLPTIDMIKVIGITLLMLTSHWMMRNSSVLQLTRKLKWWVASIAWALMLILVILSQKSSDSFIYFQF